MVENEILRRSMVSLVPNCALKRSTNWDSQKIRYKFLLRLLGGRREGGWCTTDPSRDYSYFPSMKSYLPSRWSGSFRHWRDRGGQRVEKKREIDGGPWPETRGRKGSNFSRRVQLVAKKTRGRQFREKRALRLPSVVPIQVRWPFPLWFYTENNSSACASENMMRS